MLKESTFPTEAFLITFLGIIASIVILIGILKFQYFRRRRNNPDAYPVNRRKVKGGKTSSNRRRRKR